MTEPKTHTLEVPGAVLHYDVRGNDSSTEPVLLLIGSPMGAAGFGTLAGHFADRTVVTYDPRGADRSRRTDGASESTPDEHADDLHRLISELDAGPVDIFATSGGAVNALALVAKHPEQVRTLVAHEPPASQEVPDREAVLAACADIQQTYRRSGLGPAMAKFIVLVSYQGPIPEGFADQPAPDPAQFGLPTTDDGSRDDPLVGQNIVSCNAYRHDFDALRAAPTRIVVGVGAKSGETLAARAAAAVAERLGTAPVTFPGDHGGFLGGEYGTTGEPEAFATTLRKVLEHAMDTPPIVSPEEWEAARQQLLVKEKELTRARDAMAAARRRMPWLAVEKRYEFDGPDGRASLLDLFDGRRQLIVYRAFFEPGVEGWPEHACIGCSMLADQVAHVAHLNARDTTLVFASRAPQPDIARVKARMGWQMPWYTITDEFDADFGVDEWHGTNAFIRDGDRVFRTYFVNARGDEAMGSTWSYLDITALGRQEQWEDSPEGYPQTPPYQWWIWHDEPR